MSSFADKIKQQESEAQQQGYASRGNYFKFQEGDNVFRVLTEPEMLFENFKLGTCYTDCGYEGSAKFMCYVAVTEKDLDGNDTEVIKQATLPYKIGTTIAEYQSDEDYAFESFPMPFNVKVKAKGAGTKEVEYIITPSPKQTEAHQDTLMKLNGLKTIPEIIAMKKDAQKKKHVEDGTWQKEQDRKAELKKGLEEAKAKGSLEKPKIGNTDIDYPESDLSEEDIPFGDEA